MFVMYLVGYTHWGLQGVGVAYLLAYLFSMTGIYMVCHLKFELHIPVRMFVSLLVIVLYVISFGCCGRTIIWRGLTA